MTTVTTPEPTVPPEVAAFVAELGGQHVFDTILRGLPELFPELLGIECEVDPGIPDEVDPVVNIFAWLPDIGPSDPTPGMKWDQWTLARFSGRELYQIVVLFAHVPESHDRP